MGGIGVITDSAADLPAAVVAEGGIEVVKLDVRFAAPTARDVTALDPAAFWQALVAEHAMAETAAPSPGAFLSAFTAARERGLDGVVCVTLSSGLSGTYQAAVTAARECADFPVEVVDSLSVTMSEGFLVLDAVELARSGASAPDIAASLRGRLDTLKVYGGLDSLDTLRRGGRIGSAQAFFGSLLSILPIVELRDGRVEGESRQRTRARVLRYLAEKILDAGPLKRLAIAHANAHDLDTLLEMIATVSPEHELIVTLLGPVVGAHTGPGTIGICIEQASSGSNL